MNEMILRAQNALQGLAIGDALGMPTRMLSRQQISLLFPALNDFVAAPPENFISTGQAAGSVTDDTQRLRREVRT